MTLRALTCPNCGAPVGLAYTFCTYCRAPIHVRGLLEIDPPSDKRLLDFTTGATPPGLPTGAGEGEARPVAGVGLSVVARSAKALQVAEGRPSRSSFAALTGVVHDPDGALEVGVRMTRVGNAQVGYLLRVRPALGSWSIERVIAMADKPRACQALAGEQGLRDLAALGAPTRIELCAADRLLQARVGGRLVGRTEDPYFGFGAQSWGACSYGQPARLTLVAFEYGRL